MASKTALVSEMQQQLEAAKEEYTHATRAHEAHIGQLISSINEMQELTSKQVRRGGFSAGLLGIIHHTPSTVPARQTYRRPCSHRLC